MVDICKFFVCLALVLSYGCTETARESTVEIEQRSYLVEIGPLAESQLAKIESRSEWVEAAVELSVAFRVGDNVDRADELLHEASLTTAEIQDLERRTVAFLTVGRAMAEVRPGRDVDDVLNQAERVIAAIDDPGKRWELNGKLASARASNGQIGIATAAAKQIPEDDDTLASYRARALQEIAVLAARQGDIERAVETLSLIKTGLPYYQVKARTEIAVFANEKGQGDLAAELLNVADSIARAQLDGYFVAGSLRHIAVAYAAMGDPTTAATYFTDALNGARNGQSPQHRARALSRVSTSIADTGLYSDAVVVLPEAIVIAESESNEAFRLWAFYELAGAAAFCGDFSVADRLLELIPASFRFGSSPVRAAAARDVAWGLARHNKVSEGITLAMDIKSPRESVQALSRIAGVLANPRMNAMPRYL